MNEQVFQENINTKQMMSLIHIFCCHIEANFARHLICNITIAFDIQTIVDVHKNLMTHKTISKFNQNKQVLIRYIFRINKKTYLIFG